MKTLPLTVLLHEGPIARAYLAVLRHGGYRPERILLMVYSQSPATGKRIGRWLPRGLRIPFAQKTQEMSLLYWVRWLHANHPALFDEMAERIGAQLQLPRSVFEQLPGRTPLEEYANSVERVMVSSLRDTQLVQALSRLGETAVLFTGGGILPTGPLSIPGIRFLHVHPGLLPHIRGADGLLYSTLLRGRPAASCFYLAPGLDTGDIILARELPPVALPRGAVAGLDSRSVYRAVYAFYDPVVRAKLLLQVVAENSDLLNLPAEPQDESDGVTFHFMNEVVRQAALDRLFAEMSSESASSRRD